MNWWLQTAIPQYYGIVHGVYDTGRVYFHFITFDWGISSTCVIG